MATKKKKKKSKRIGRPKMPVPKGYWDVVALAAKEGVAVNTIYSWIYQGKLDKCAKRDDGHWIIKKSAYRRPSRRAA